ncbi:DUF6642 family protein [Flavobacterium sp.]|uniref:DUF6642 family protein n=1 Tax=Flavobacterium sp. TaxID=239 RepID=UPI0026374F06|nr:DUF6642 family protein [Flavobacterium sp.]
MTSNHNIYCLEHVPDVEAPHQSPILPALENLALHYGVTNVYATCDSIEGFEASISTLVYEDRHFKDYTIIYLVFEGSGNEIKIDNYYYTLEEIAEFFEGKLTGKIVHFANTMILDLESSTFQYFIDVTGAKAISGYGNPLPVLSAILDNLYFALADECDDVIELVEVLHEKQYALCKAMGFRLYY